MDWHHPFKLALLDHEVDVLRTPPLQVMGILRAHVRRDLDRRLIESLCHTRGWDLEEVELKYRHGIDWEAARCVLRGKATRLPPVQRRALEVLMCNGYWWDARRCDMGYADDPMCKKCGDFIGTPSHSLHGECEATALDLALRVAGGGSRCIPNRAKLPGL